MASLSEDLDSLVICKKEERLIQAIYENNVELLKVLLDSPELYKITDKRGKNLLQISVVEEKKEVFDYLLSLPDYPLEFKNPEDITLELALDYPWTEEKEYFACELIEKGACIDKICDKDRT